MIQCPLLHDLQVPALRHGLRQGAGQRKARAVGLRQASLLQRLEDGHGVGQFGQGAQVLGADGRPTKRGERLDDLLLLFREGGEDLIGQGERYVPGVPLPGLRLAGVRRMDGRLRGGPQLVCQLNERSTALLRLGHGLQDVQRQSVQRRAQRLGVGALFLAQGAPQFSLDQHQRVAYRQPLE